MSRQGGRYIKLCPVCYQNDIEIKFAGYRMYYECKKCGARFE